MKKFTIMLLAALVAVASFAKVPVAKAVRIDAPKAQMGQMVQNVGKVDAKRTITKAMVRAPKKAASDFSLITTQPEGELKTYKRGGDHYFLQGQNLYYGAQSGTIDIVWGADNKVYFKDLVSGLDGVGVWEKGTLSEDGKTITVALGQNIYYSSQYDACIAMALINYIGEEFVVNTDAQNVTFTIEDGVLSLQDTGFSSVSLGGIWTDDNSIGDYGDYESVYTEYVEDLTVITPPVSALAISFDAPMQASTLAGNAVNATVKVAIDITNNQLYIQGLLQVLPEAWAKGDIDLETGEVTFPIQFVGFDEQENKYYLAAYASGGLAPLEMTIGGITFPTTITDLMQQYTAGTLDFSQVTISSSDYLIANNNGVSFSYGSTNYEIYQGVFIGIVPETLQLPEGLEAVEMPYKGYLYDAEKKFSAKAKVAINGKDVYFQGLCTDLPDAWVKGTFDEEGTTVTIPMGQYVGMCEYGPVYLVADPIEEVEEGSEINATDIVFICDAEQNYYELQNNMFYSLKQNDIYYYECVEAGAVIGQKPTFITTTATFDFNKMDVPVSYGKSGEDTYTQGDITETLELTAEEVTLEISPADEGKTATRFWKTDDGPQLRCYSNTLTFSVPEGKTITTIVFNYNGKYWGGNDNAGKVTADSGTLKDDSNLKAATWTGEAQTVVFTIEANTQINCIVVTYVEAGAPVEEDPVLVELPEGVEPEEYTLDITQYNYSSSNGWVNVSDMKTALVAFDGDDVYVSGLAYWFEDSYVKGKKNADGNYVFKASQFVGEDSYGEEYLVGASIVGEGEDIAYVASDYVFEFDAEARTLVLADGYALFESEAAGDTENIFTQAIAASYTPGAVVIPDVVELPEGAEVNNWYLAAYDSDEAFVNREVAVAFVGNDIYVQGLCDILPEAWVKGTVDGETATFTTGQFYGTYESYSGNYNLFFVGSDGTDVKDVVFTYDAENGRLSTEDHIVLASDQKMNKMYDYYFDVEITRDRPDSFPVEAPEDLATETYLFKAMQLVESDDESYEARKVEGDEEAAETEVTIDFNEMDLPMSWNASASQGIEASTAGDITETYELTAENITLSISPKEEGKSTENRFWKTNNGPQLRVYSGTLTFEVPEGCSMTQIVFNPQNKWNSGNSADSGEFDGATWTGNAQTVVVTIAGNSQINSIEVTYTEPGEELAFEPYTYQTEVGFDGNDVYFKGFSDDTAEFWAKGTLSEDGKTVTIPACQYMGAISFLGYTFDYYLTAMDEDGGFADLVLNYDAATNTFTTDQVMVLNGYKDDWYPYQTFIEVEITKMPEFAATPADPVLQSYDFENKVGYNTIYASIPTVDVDGNDLLTSKLFYTIWIEKDGKEQPYTFTAALYDYDFEEDVTEVPYDHDGYDIYKGGEIIYLEEELDELASWTNVGIQSIYYGGGECNKSNIVWYDNEYNDPTGIADIKTDGKKAVVFDLQGRRVAKATKGLYIVNGKKVVVK